MITEVNVYTLEDLAEKMRTLIQRTRPRVLFNWESVVKVEHPEQKTVFFGEQRMNIAYFLKILRGWNGTSLVLVAYFYKVDCRNYATRVVI